ncbi:MAG: hypothetical protein WAL88_00110, partial [Nitrosotalea sp.]
MTKIALLMFAATVLLISSVIVAVPQASALTPSTYLRNTFATQSHGSSNICGDHVCASGEHTRWYDAIDYFQKGNYGKVAPAQHGEDILAQIIAAFTGSTTMPSNMNMPGNNVMSGSMHMHGNSTMPG